MLINYKEELPIGFGLSLAMNEAAMQKFSGMSETQKEAVVESSRHVVSHQEMENLVSNLAEGKWSI